MCVLSYFNEVQFDIEQQKASVEFEMSYSATLEKGSENIEFKGEGIFDLIFEYDYWSVVMIDMPGLVI